MINKTVKQKYPKLRFPDCKGNWQEIKLESITSKVGSGSTPLGGESVYCKEGIPFIRSQNVTNDRLILDETHIPIEVHTAMKGSKILSNDILLNITGGSIGRSCVVPYSFKEGNVNQHVCIIRLRTGVPKFFQTFLSSNRGQKLIWQGQTGSGREGLNFQSIRLFKINIPSLPEQKKIADFLTAVDDKIQQLTRKKELLEEYKKGVMQKIFSQEIRFKIKNEVGELVEPPDWKNTKLSAFLIPTLRAIDKPEKNYLAIGIRSHCKGTFQKPDSEPDRIMMDTLYVVKKNDLIVNITFAWEGAIALVKEEDEGGLVSHRFPTYTFKKEKVLYEFFQYVFIQKKFIVVLNLISPGGAGRNRVLSKNDFLKIKWELPEVKEQQKIADFLSVIDKKIELSTKELEQVQTFKKGLLQQMFV